MTRSANRLLLATVLTLSALLAGCAQPLKKQAYNREAATHIKTVVVTQAENQDEYPVIILGHPGMGFGLVGGLIAAADMQAKTGRLTTAIDPKETRVQERFSAKLGESLRRAGYQVQVVSLPKDVKEEGALAAAKQRAQSDAVVHVTLYAGYWAAGPTTDYFPRMLAKVKAFDARSGQVLYEDSISYGYTVAGADTVHHPSDAAFRFANIDLLVADPAKARQGLYDGIDVLTAQLIADLKNN